MRTKVVCRPDVGGAETRRRGVRDHLGRGPADVNAPLGEAGDVAGDGPSGCTHRRPSGSPGRIRAGSPALPRGAQLPGRDFRAVRGAQFAAPARSLPAKPSLVRPAAHWRVRPDSEQDRKPRCRAGISRYERRLSRIGIVRGIGHGVRCGEWRGGRRLRRAAPQRGCSRHLWRSTGRIATRSWR